MPPPDHISVRVIEHGGYRWAALSDFAKDHEITGENCSIVDQKYSFKAGHRVRIYKIKKNVHWRLPSDVVLEITNVPPRKIR
jgi:hypothetical protein